MAFDKLWDLEEKAYREILCSVQENMLTVPSFVIPSTIIQRCYGVLDDEYVYEDILDAEFLS